MKGLLDACSIHKMSVDEKYSLLHPVSTAEVRVIPSGNSWDIFKAKFASKLTVVITSNAKELLHITQSGVYFASSNERFLLKDEPITDLMLVRADRLLSKPACNGKRMWFHIDQGYVYHDSCTIILDEVTNEMDDVFGNNAIVRVPLNKTYQL